MMCCFLSSHFKNFLNNDREVIIKMSKEVNEFICCCCRNNNNNNNSLASEKLESFEEFINSFRQEIKEDIEQGKFILIDKLER